MLSTGQAASISYKQQTSYGDGPGRSSFIQSISISFANTTTFLLYTVRMSTNTTLQIPNGVANPDLDVACVTGPQGFIHCLDLATGEDLAQTDFPATPLTIDGDTLIGWTPAAGDPQRADLFAAVPQGDILQIKWREPLQLPNWVAVDSIEEDDFSIAAGIQEQQLAVTWEAHSRYEGGAYPPAFVESASSHDEQRTITLNPETGEETAPDLVEMAPIGEAKLPQIPSTKRVVPYQSGAKWETQPWHYGSADLLLVRDANEPGILLLRREDGAHEAQEIRLTSDPNAVAAVTPDGSHIFIQQPGAKTPSWPVFLTTGEQVAELPFEPGAGSVAVVNERVLYDVTDQSDGILRRTLFSRDMQTAEPLWSFLLSEELPQAPPSLRASMY